MPGDRTFLCKIICLHGQSTWREPLTVYNSATKQKCFVGLKDNLKKQKEREEINKSKE